MIFSEYCEIFKATYFEEHLMSASDFLTRSRSKDFQKQALLCI